jgi:hypothetical protein
LCWTICGAFAFPVLAAALIEQRLGHAESESELIGVILFLMALGVTVSLLELAGLLRHRSGLAIVLAPMLFLIVLFVIGIAGVNLGIVAP